MFPQSADKVVPSFKEIKILVHLQDKLLQCWMVQHLPRDSKLLGNAIVLFKGYSYANNDRVICLYRDNSLFLNRSDTF
jgi:hypothetical protein